ncbi:hypothetical protein Ade02nite_09780 [Paractinoplanes deccanensis]|uniref:Uncharacterized protein n=1 Tax=Paractinoplanes deccanensis TaxID=113561 RepID=A0ABQ3XXE5_9ACTN|nr:hypothetical protein [Actinoplanes deccanensis]GID72337.1 hypothetical protein Ade02nite_09780 [Actinoplanes deccanensis]
MIVPRQAVVDELRRRGQDVRADFVERQLPEQVDSTRHGGLLATLHINLDELTESPERRPED